jgi:hypothetical protein
MCLRGIARPPAFAANQRHSLMLPLSGRRVTSRVPPRLCDEHLAWRFGGGRSAIVRPGAALAHELETSAIAQTAQISNRILWDVSAG